MRYLVGKESLFAIELFSGQSSSAPHMYSWRLLTLFAHEPPEAEDDSCPQYLQTYRPGCCAMYMCRRCGLSLHEPLAALAD